MWTILLSLSVSAHAGPYAIPVPEVARVFTDDPNLPGRASVFDNYLENFALAHSAHPPVTEMMKQIYEIMAEDEQIRRALLNQTCAAMLDDPSDHHRAEHNLATARYLAAVGHRVEPQARPGRGDEGWTHQTQILPGGAPQPLARSSGPTVGRAADPGRSGGLDRSARSLSPRGHLGART